jgi:hypothetical protein
VLNDRTGIIVDQIELQTATTLQGLQVKMRAPTWCCSGEPITAQKLHWFDSEPTTDMRLLASIVTDLAAMGGA